MTKKNLGEKYKLIYFGADMTKNRVRIIVRSRF